MPRALVQGVACGRPQWPAHSGPKDRGTRPSVGVRLGGGPAQPLAPRAPSVAVGAADPPQRCGCDGLHGSSVMKAMTMLDLSRVDLGDVAVALEDHSHYGGWCIDADTARCGYVADEAVEGSRSTLSGRTSPTPCARSCGPPRPTTPSILTGVLMTAEEGAAEGPSLRPSP